MFAWSLGMSIYLWQATYFRGRPSLSVPPSTDSVIMSVVALAKYLTRITPALALFGLSLLLWKSLASLTRHSQNEATDRRLEPETTFWQWLLSIHLVSLHIVTALIPLRAVRALGHTTSKMRETAGKLSPLHSPADALRFAVIIPAYKETRETLRTTLSVLASHPQAQTCYDVRRPFTMLPDLCLRLIR